MANSSIVVWALLANSRAFASRSSFDALPYFISSDVVDFNHTTAFREKTLFLNF